jgi:transcriptional regulator with XRE-family HTH domain
MNTPLKTPISELIQLKMCELGVSMNELARDADVSAGGLSKIIHGETKEPHPRTLRKLATALKVPVLELMAAAYPDIYLASNQPT